MKRISSIDLLRGIVMVIMALDHVRDYFYFDLSFDPTDLTRTTAPIYLTRWVTHFCAPVFFFLTGASAFLAGQKLPDKKTLSRWLFTRGLWMIFLEFTVIKLALFFELDYSFTILMVIWALGWAMIALAALIWLPINAILITGFVIVLGHNALDGITSFSNPGLTAIWQILHVSFTQIEISPGIILFVIYPILPWIGATALGYCFGQMFSPTVEKERRRRFLLRTGLGVMIFFVVLRFTNLYGDPSPWSAQASPLFTFFSFINVAKYPPSLLYLCATLGPAILFLAFAEKEPGWLGKKFITIGRVPMFYYIIHFYAIHTLASIAAVASGFKFSDTVGFFLGRENLQGYGFSLGIVYLIWFLIVLMIYPACAWFNGVKQRHPEKWWLKYI